MSGKKTVGTKILISAALRSLATGDRQTGYLSSLQSFSCSTYSQTGEHQATLLISSKLNEYSFNHNA